MVVEKLRRVREVELAADQDAEQARKDTAEMIRQARSSAERDLGEAAKQGREQGARQRAAMIDKANAEAREIERESLDALNRIDERAETRMDAAVDILLRETISAGSLEDGEA